MQISRLIGIVAEGADYEFSQHILLLHHIERHIKKFRSDNEVHRNVILARRQYLMIRKLIEEEKIPLFQHNPGIIINNVCGASAAHIDYLNVIMSMLRESYEPRMRPYIDKAALVKHLLSTDGEFTRGRIAVFAYLFA